MFQEEPSVALSEVARIGGGHRLTLRLGPQLNKRESSVRAVPLINVYILYGSKERKK